MKTFYWYEAVVAFQTEDEKTGKIKEKKEVYLVKATNPTDVEVTLHKELGELNDFRVKDVKEKTNIVAVILPEGIALND